MTEIRRATAEDAGAIADVYLESFKTALPTVALAHSADEIRAYVRGHLVAETECWVVVDDERVVAMIALQSGWIEQLYVAPDRQGEGIGRRLLELAKARAAAGGLQLWTFQVNAPARRFYEQNGFVAEEMTDGAANEEREPDVRYVWRR